MPAPAWLIPILAQIGGTALGYLQDDPKLPRVDTTAAVKAQRLIADQPSGSTVVQEGREALTQGVGAVRSQIARLVREGGLDPSMIATLIQQMEPGIFSSYVQGLGRLRIDAQRADISKATALSNIAQIIQGGQAQNAQIALREEQLQVNPLETGAFFGEIAGSVVGGIEQNRFNEDILKALRELKLGRLT